MDLTFWVTNVLRIGAENFSMEEKTCMMRGSRTGISSDVEKVVRERHQFTISELSLEFPQVCRNVLYEIFTKKLRYHKFSDRWVPKMFTDVHKTQRMASALKFLQGYQEEGEEFLDKILTGDETWVKFVKEQSRQWMHTHSKNKPRKFKKTLAKRKLMASVF